MTLPIQTLERQTVQEFEPRESQGAPLWYALPVSNPNDDTLLPEWGLHVRDRELRLLYRNQFNWIAQSAIAALIRKYTQTPYEVKGGRNLVSYFQNMLQDAEFGNGWSDFSALWLLDYLTCDYGAYWEIIGGGKPDRELKGRVTGIAHLDSLRCVPTGNLEFPVIYWSRRTGKMHRLHHTRVVRLVDMRDGDEMRFGAGLCSLSRAIAMIQQQIPLMKYVAGMMSDTPANGVMFLEGLTASQYTTAMNAYKLERERGFKGPAVVSGTNSGKISGQYIPFAVAPEGFDYATYIDIAVNAFATAFGIDRQDIWPLQGKMAGTATQSEVMAAKAMGMAYGDLLSKVKRAINTRVLPPSMEFDFEYRDEEKDKQVAERTGLLLNNANMLRGLGVSDEVIVRYLAAQDETLRDVMLDEDGNIIALPDDDVVETDDVPETTDALADETTAADDEGEDPTAPDETTQATDGENIKTRTIGDFTYTFRNVDGFTLDGKDITDTQTAFMQRFDSILASARSNEINRSRAGILFRGLLSNFGPRAYGDGMEEAGVPRDRMDKDDRAEIQSMLAQQSAYVTNFLDTLYGPTGITDGMADGKAVMWFNKSINPFYDAGRMSAGANGMREFVLGPTEHCDSCKLLAGQIHRLKEFLNSGWHPKSSRLKCKGFRCECELVRRPGSRARGVLPA